MLNHEHYRELCALAAIGQLSAEEDRELDQHLCECASCRAANAEYSHVVQHQLPQADPVRWRFKNLLPKTLPEADLRDRFLARARAEGAEFSPEVLKAGYRGQVTGYRKRNALGFWGKGIGDRKIRGWTLAFAMAAVAAVALLGTEIYRLEVRPMLPQPSRGNEARLMQENASLRAQLTSIQQSIERQSEKLAAASKDKTTSEQSLQQLQKQLAEMQTKSESLSARLQQMEIKDTELTNESRQKDSAIADLSAKNEKLHKENVDNLSARLVLEAQLRDLNDSIKQQAISFDQERQLMAASTDVRQLMGARNLHIMDVHDTDGAGKSAKAFGRVFYSEGQSLIFYAFDLPNGKLTPAKYTFEAWGENESVSHSVRNLGTFAVDDHEQHRWVLKVNDPKLLKGIDSVFVTAETAGDVDSPHGKKLLYAFIVGEPNHP
jgi:hypothetical protein